MDLSPQDLALLARFEQQLFGSGFTRQVVAHHLDTTEPFLRYLQQGGVAASGATPRHVSQYLDAQLQRYRRKHSRSPRSMISWHYWHTTGIHSFLRFIQGRWPPPPTPANRRERAIQRILTEYEQVQRASRALTAATIVGHVYEARRFLYWLPGQDIAASLTKLTICDVDRYMKARAAGYARATCKLACNNLRSLLRFLHDGGRISCDLTASLLAPRLYRYEGIPSRISGEQIRTLLADARRDRSPRGLRNYAMLMLLAVYGLRAGEVCRLQLRDIDWRGERLWIRHTKTGGESYLPLLPSVGHAILGYVQHARPRCKDPEVFIRLSGPRGAFSANTALYSMLRRQMARLGIRLTGKRGSHVFRHARAASLLRAGVPLKTIGDLLGHRSASSTAVYLKLDDQELRNVALPLPLPEVSP